MNNSHLGIQLVIVCAALDFFGCFAGVYVAPGAPFWSACHANGASRHLAEPIASRVNQRVVCGVPTDILVAVVSLRSWPADRLKVVEVDAV